MNLLIVDGEAATRAGFAKLCQRNADVRIVGAASSGGEGIEAVEALRPDLVLLDAELPDMSGFDVLRALPPWCRRRTILVTTCAEHAVAALAAGVLDYLVKPVSAAAFSASILRARGRLSIINGTGRRRRRSSAVVPFRADVEQYRPLVLIGEREHRLYPLEPQNIEYIEAAGNYVQYRTANALYIARETIKQLDAALAPLGFVRIERSLLLNIRAICYAEPIGHGTFAFTLLSGARLTSGPAYREGILDVMPLRRRASLRAIEGAHAP
jgi:two-component system LytT family response regulator